MPRLSELKPAVADRARWVAEFPGAGFGYLGDLTSDLPIRFENALAERREEVIQRLLADNPYLLQYAINNSGHHGIWVFPKQMIRSPAGERAAGLIPDFLVATRSSLGYFWHVVEIKRADPQFGNLAGTGLSTDAHRALVQCNSYLAHMSDYTESVRANIAIPDLIRPMGAILLIGDAAKETEIQRKVRANHVKANPNLSIVSYDRIRRGLANDVRPRG